MNPWIEVAGWTLVHFLWQGTLIGAIAVMLLRCLRARSPQARYGAACAALVATLAAPLITALVLSRADVPVPPTSPDSSRAAIESARATIEERLLALSASVSGGADATRSVSDTRDAEAVVSQSAWLPAIVALWMTGVGLLLIRLAGGWWQVRGLRRAVLASDPSRWSAAGDRIASSLGLTRVIRIVDSALVDTPLMIGWLKPVIVLPVAALGGLSPSQIEAILAHEIAHIRRHDFIVNLLQTFAETMLFYHPAVWWISGRIRIEREHCCDLVATSVSGDPISYAEALVELARWRMADSPLALSATGGSLLIRVRRLLGVPDDERPRTTLGVIAIVCALVVLAGATRFLGTAHADDDAAVVRVQSQGSGDAAAWQMVFNQNDSQMRFIGFRGRDLIRFAYQVPAARVIGGPRWMDEEILRLVVTLDAAPRADEMPAVVQRVLEERLHLKTHIESRNFPVLALVRAGAWGPNMKASTRDCFDLQEWIDAGQPLLVPPNQPSRNASHRPMCGQEDWSSRMAQPSFVAITMPQFAEELRGVARGWPTTNGVHITDVIDRTGLTGRYDLKLEGFRLPVGLTGRIPELARMLEPLGLLTWPRILEEQLGLTLEEAEAPYDVIVIDSAERPVE